MFAILALFLTLLVTFRYYLPVLQWKNRPPGPILLPMMGSTIELQMTDRRAMEYPHRVMHILAQKYGPVMSVGLGDEIWVVLTGLEAIKKFSMDESAMSRPKLPVLEELYSFGKALGVIFSSGPLWKEQRKFMMRTLREFGVGKSTMENHILDEIAFLKDKIDQEIKEGNSVMEVSDMFNVPCLNVIWRLVSGQRFDYGDPRLKGLIASLETFTMEKAMGPITGVFYLKYIPPFKQIYQNVKNHMTSFQTFLADFVKKSEGETKNEGYIDAFNSARETGQYFSTEQLVISVQDFFTGGSGTMSKTLAFSILYLIRHPKAQEKIYKELKDIIQDREDQAITMQDRKRMPFTEATMLEVQRLGSVLPISPPREASKDMEIGGYTIKKGTKVQMNLYSLHRNEQHWGGNAEEFQPERFLNEDRTEIIQDEWLQPFGYGKRKCVGENVARMTILMYLANLLLDYRFSSIDSAEIEPEGGLTIGPKLFKAKIEPRK